MNEQTSENPYASGEPADGQVEAKPTKPIQSKFRPLRIWPVILLLLCLWGMRILPGLLSPEVTVSVMMASFMGPLVSAGLILLWWLLFSRSLWKERALGLLGLAIIVVVTTALSDKTIRGFGTMVYALPWGITAFAVTLIVWSRAESTRRTWLALLAALVGFGFWGLVRTDEIHGNFHTVHHWRWEPSSEDRFLESISADAEATVVDDALPAEPEWPSFRGPDRRGVQPGIVLATDWNAHPPKEIWRRKVGPGWSSFSVAGRRLFTQEQRGDYEAVVCYEADSGEQIWSQQVESRFWEVVGGAGPRATPTISGGNLYTLGAAGFLHRLDPITGEQIWQRDINKDANREPPTWGYASSPLVTNELVIVHAGGPTDLGVLAYDIQSGELRWSSPAGDHSYSSPQLSTICGKTCVLMLTNKGLTLINAEDGEVLGEHEWLFEGYRVVQPLTLDDTDVLLGTAMGTGTQRIKMSLDGEKFKAEEVWESRGMSPYYNDYVIHKGYLYGFDNNIFACVDAASGDRQWKRGRYGNGQVLLLPEGDQLLVLSETGELVLLEATPEQHTELTRFQALTGRTWNHPVLIGNRLYVRNSEEAACFEMPLTASTALMKEN